MAENLVFPDLVNKVLPVRAAILMVRNNRSVLEDPNCPYDKVTKEFLMTFCDTGATPLAPNGEISNADLDDYEIVEKQILRSINEMTNFQKDLATSDLSDKLSYHKVISGLLEKFITLREKTRGVKEAAEFMKTTMGIVQDIFTPEQRTMIMERLAPYSRK